MTIIIYIKIIVDIYCFPAIFAGQIKRTLAVKMVGEIDAGGAGGTGSGRAVGHVVLTELSAVAGWTNTLERRPDLSTGSSVLAQVGRASVVFQLTSNTGEFGRTRTVESTSVVVTRSSVHTRVANAAPRSRLTSLSVCSRWTSVETNNFNNDVS